MLQYVAYSPNRFVNLMGFWRSGQASGEGWWIPSQSVPLRFYCKNGQHENWVCLVYAKWLLCVLSLLLLIYKTKIHLFRTHFSEQDITPGKKGFASRNRTSSQEKQDPLLGTGRRHRKNRTHFSEEDGTPRETGHTCRNMTSTQEE